MFSKITSKKLALLSALVTIFLATTAFYQQTPWNAPASANEKKNPLTADAATLESAKAVYVKECQSCHGKKGKGDGPSASTLDVQAGNFSTVATQEQIDGALF